MSSRHDLFVEPRPIIRCGHLHVLREGEVDRHARCGRFGGIYEDDFAYVGRRGKVKELRNQQTVVLAGWSGTKPTLVIHFGAPCWTPMSRSLLMIPVSGSTLLSIVSTEETWVAYGFGYLRCREART